MSCVRVCTGCGRPSPGPGRRMPTTSTSAELGAPTPPPGIPHPFSLGDSGKLAALLADAGLSDVVVGEVPTPYHAASFDEWWERGASLAGPLAQRLASLPAGAMELLRARA